MWRLIANIPKPLNFFAMISICDPISLWPIGARGYMRRLAGTMTETYGTFRQLNS